MDTFIKEIKKLVDIMPANTVIYKVSDKLERIYYSAGIPRLSGYTIDEFESIDQDDAMALVLPSDRSIITTKLGQCIRNHQDVDFVYRLVHKENGSVWVHANARIVGEADDAPVLLATLIDVSHEMQNNSLLLNASDRGIVVFDQNNKEILYGNDAFFEIANTTAEESLGRPCYDVICKAGCWDPDSCICFKIMNQNKTVETYNEKRNRTYTMFSRTLTWGEHDAVAFYMSDITDIRVKDRELADRNAELAHIHSEAIRAYRRQLDAVMRLNPDALSTFSMNLTQNICANAVTQYPNLKDLAAKGTVDGYFSNAAKYTSQKDYDRMIKTFNREHLLNAFNDGETTVIGNCLFKVSDDDIRFIRTTITMAQNPLTHDVEGIIYTLDLTKHEQNANIIKQLFKKQYEGAIIIDVRNSRSTLLQFDYNPEVLAKIQTVDYDTGLQHLVDQYILPDDQANYLRHSNLQTIVDHLNTQEVYAFTSLFHFPNGKDLLKRISYYYLNATRDSILCLTEDITDITRQEQERVAELKEALLVADRAIDAKATFFSNISHDMRTPLNGVLGFADIARQATTIEEKDECLDKIQSSGSFLLQLINDTLDMSKMDSNNMKLFPETYDPVVINQDIINAVEQNAKAKNVTLKVAGPTKTVKHIRVDKLRLQQVIVNLLGNAIKFTPEGGTVEFRSQFLNPPVHGCNCLTTIKDNGIGMKEEFIPHAFDAFSQQQSSANHQAMGTGLGLAIVKQIVNLMHGTIELKSTEGVGTQFDVYLPLELVDPVAPTIIKESAITDLSGRHILMCEDHPINRDLAIRLLTKQGMLVDSAQNGRIGVDTYTQAGAGGYDAVLMDMRMPEMDGLEASRAIREIEATNHWPHTPILAMTANAFESDRQACLDAGMDDHLAKPIIPRDLYAMLQKVMK